eukprot:m.234896 g.234896  ORF g.234896 m.234896 type:complete len:1253 (-) comp33663_c0_seq1:194-3952(-)
MTPSHKPNEMHSSLRRQSLDVCPEETGTTSNPSSPQRFVSPSRAETRNAKSSRMRRSFSAGVVEDEDKPKTPPMFHSRMRYSSSTSLNAPLGTRKLSKMSEEDLGTTASSPAFVSFLPRKLRKQLIKKPDAASASVERFDGAVLFVDVSGFTALNERLKEEDEHTAAERMCGILNSFFKSIIDTIYRNGGDVIKFSGDAVTVLWIVGETQEFPDMQSVAQRATFCSEAIHDCTANNPNGLTLHMAVGVGSLTGLQVGGALHRMEYILAGTPMDQISIGEGLAAKTETCLSPEVWEYLKCLGDKCTASLVNQLDDDYYQNSPVKSKLPHEQALERQLRKKYHREPNFEGYRILDRDQFKQWRIEQIQRIPPKNENLFSMLKLDPSEDSTQRRKSLLTPIVKSMKQFIPGAVVRRLSDGQDVRFEGKHLAEMLKLSVLFICIQGLDLQAKDDSDLERVKNLGQRLMLRIQESVYSCEGNINKVLVDDKGLLCVCALGLPPMYHGDDPKRAVKIAGYLLQSLESLAEHPKVKIGVTTGSNVFCGVVGSKVRREYTIMGPVVNLAARLMSQAEWGGIMVDEATKSAAKEFCYGKGVDAHLKGIGVKTIYPPEIPIKIKKASKTKTNKRDFNKILDDLEWGRADRISQLFTVLRRCKTKRSGVIVLTGGRGCGKTFMVERMPEIARGCGFITIDSTGSKSRPDAMKFDDYQMFRKLYKTNGIDNYVPRNGWSMFAAWHEIVEKCVSEAAMDRGVPEAAWIDAALATYEIDGDFPLAGQAYLLKDIVPSSFLNTSQLQKQFRELDEESVTDPRRKRFSKIFGNGGESRINQVKEVLKAILTTFAVQKNQPVLLTIHLKRETDIINSIDENWQLLLECGIEANNLIVAAITRHLNTSSQDEKGNKIVGQILEFADQDESNIDMMPFDARKRVQFAADLLSHADIQGSHHAPFNVSAEDLMAHPNLVKVLSDVAAGNPKYILEFIDPLTRGYTDPRMYKSLEENAAVIEEHIADWSKPAIKIVGDGRIEIICKDLSKFPPPLKISEYMWQEYETLPVHHRYVLKVASSFAHGFTVDMLWSILHEDGKNKAEVVLVVDELTGLDGFLTLLDVSSSDQIAEDSEGRLLLKLNEENHSIYQLRSNLLKLLVRSRFTVSEQADLMLRRKHALATCRWRRIQQHVAQIQNAKASLVESGYHVTERSTFESFTLAQVEQSNTIDSLRNELKEQAETHRLQQLGFLVLAMVGVASHFMHKHWSRFGK